MPFEGEKFEIGESTSPPQEEKEEEKKEEVPPEALPEKTKELEEEKGKEKVEEKSKEVKENKEEKISPEEEKIYQEYWRIEEKQGELWKESREKKEEMIKEKEKELGIKFEEASLQLREEEFTFKKTGKGRKKIEEMKNPLKKEILKKFKEVDPQAPEKITEELKKRREELGEEIWRIGEETRGTGNTSFLKKEKEEIERVIRDFENKDPKSLKNFTEQELKETLRDEWSGKSGLEELKRTIFLKKVLNTIEKNR